MKKRIASYETSLDKQRAQATEKEENKAVSLGTSKINYIDPRCR